METEAAYREGGGAPAEAALAEGGAPASPERSRGSTSAAYFGGDEDGLPSKAHSTEAATECWQGMEGSSQESETVKGGTGNASCYTGNGTSARNPEEDDYQKAVKVFLADHPLQAVEPQDIQLSSSAEISAEEGEAGHERENRMMELWSLGSSSRLNTDSIAQRRTKMKFKLLNVATSVAQSGRNGHNLQYPLKSIELEHVGEGWALHQSFHNIYCENDDSQQRTNPINGTPFQLSFGPQRYLPATINHSRVEQVVQAGNKYTFFHVYDKYSDRAGDALLRVKWMIPYFQVIGFVSLTIADLGTAFRFHFLNGGSAMCRLNMAPDVLPRGSVEEVAFSSLAIIAILHLLRMVSKAANVDRSGKTIGFRLLYDRKIFGREEIYVTDMMLISNIAVICFLSMHYRQCQYIGTPYFNEWDKITIRRVHGNCHSLRAFFSLQRCFQMGKMLRNKLQTVVSVNKRRYICKKTGVDLDLTYITDRVIGMAVPAVEGALHRNNIANVAKFLAVNHYGHFLVVNLCQDHEEGGNGNYHSGLLYQQVLKIPFFDHNAPRLQVLVTYCVYLSKWLDMDSKNIVCVHCQGGKGRTGTFIAALLLWTGFCKSAQHALDTYCYRRTERLRKGEHIQGPSSPSQIRYMHYLEAIVYEGVDHLSVPPKYFHALEFKNIGDSQILQAPIAVVVEVNGRIEKDTGKTSGLLSFSQMEAKALVVDLGNVLIQGDVRVRVYSFDRAASIPTTDDNSQAVRCGGSFGPGGRTIHYGTTVGKQLIFVSFHTAFHRGDVEFEKSQIDGVYNASAKYCPNDFALSCKISDTPTDEARMAIALPDEGKVSASYTAMLKKMEDPSVSYDKESTVLKAIFERHYPSKVYHFEQKIVGQPERFFSGGVLKVSYVTKGHFLCMHETRRRIDFNEQVSMGLDAAFRGEGELVVVYSPILHTETDSKLTFTANTAHAKVKQLEVPLTMSRHLPLGLEFLTSQELAYLYRALARDLCSQVDFIIEQLVGRAERRSHQMIVSDEGEDEKMELDVRARRAIPDTDHLLLSVSISRMLGDNQIQGKCWVFSNHFVFEPCKSLHCQQSAVVIPVQSISSVDTMDNTVSLSLEGSQLPYSRVKSEDSLLKTKRCDSDSAGSFKILGETPTKKHSPAFFTDFVSRRGSRRSSGRRDSLQDTASKIMEREKLHSEDGLSFTFPNQHACASFLSSLSVRMSEIEQEKLGVEEAFNESEMVRIGRHFGYVLSEDEADPSAEEFLNRLFSIAEFQTFQEHQTVIDGDSEEKKIVHILAGKAYSILIDSRHTEVHKAGEIVGLHRFLHPNSSSGSTVVASTQVLAMSITYNQVEGMCQLSSGNALRFYRGVVHSAARHLTKAELLIQSWERESVREGKKASPVASSCNSPTGPRSPKRKKNRGDESPASPHSPGSSRQLGRYGSMSEANALSVASAGK